MGLDCNIFEIILYPREECICVYFYAGIHETSGAIEKMQEYVIQRTSDCDRKATQIGLSLKKKILVSILKIPIVPAFIMAGSKSLQCHHQSQFLFTCQPCFPLG